MRLCGARRVERWTRLYASRDLRATASQITFTPHISVCARFCSAGYATWLHLKSEQGHLALDSAMFLRARRMKAQREPLQLARLLQSNSTDSGGGGLLIALASE